MTDVLIRNVSDRVLQALNLAATRQGLSRNEYLGNVLERTAHQSDTRVTTRHLKNLAHAFAAPTPDTTEPAPPEPVTAEPDPATTELAPPESADGEPAPPDSAQSTSPVEPSPASTTQPTEPTAASPTEPAATTVNQVESLPAAMTNKGCSCPG